MAIHTNGVNGVAKPDYDTIVIGAGFAGLRMIHELQGQKQNFKVVEAGSNVGGTWNRYPGAQTDLESWIYILNFSNELNAEWTWKERFPRQPEMLEYLNHVADRFDMRKYIQFNTRVSSAHYDESTSLWTMTTEQGESWTCKYFVSASGVLSVGQELPFEGHTKFKGESYRSYAWPKHEVSLTGKRIAIVGTGASGVQILPMVAHEAKHVTVFQRKPNWVLPARDHPLSDEQQRGVKARYTEIWELMRNEMFGMDFVDTPAKMMEQPSDLQIKRVLESGWETGGLRFIFQTFADLLTSPRANEICCDFMRDKIRSIVKDQETAELLCPDYVFMAKRPPLGHYYFEAYNKPHVQLISIEGNPIKEITEKGIRLEKKDARTHQDEYEFDVIIYAIGFDASTGALNNIDVRGKNNQSLRELWSKRLETYLAITLTGFPNLFMISGPHSPFANFPLIIDNTSDWIGKLMAYMETNNLKYVEPKQKATEQWSKLLLDVFHMTVLPESASKVGSYYIGANVKGKQVTPLFWFGGVKAYIQICTEEQDANYPEHTFG